MMQESGNKSVHTKLVSNTIGMITQHIRDRDLGPGDKLPSESSLVKELQVSRSVIREAFSSLAAMRLINLSTGKRATVAHLDHGAMSMMIEHGVLTEQISVQQIYDVRRTIETRTATLASLRRSEIEAQTIRHHAEQMKVGMDNDDETQVMEHDLAFHLAIAKASRNPIFAVILGAFQEVSRQSWSIGWRSRQGTNARLAMIQLHLDIADAIIEGNPQQASAVMVRHFDDNAKVRLDAGLI